MRFTVSLVLALVAVSFTASAQASYGHSHSSSKARSAPRTYSKTSRPSSAPRPRYVAQTSSLTPSQKMALRKSQARKNLQRRIAAQRANQRKIQQQRITLQRRVTLIQNRARLRPRPATYHGYRIRSTRRDCTPRMWQLHHPNCDRYVLNKWGTIVQKKSRAGKIVLFIILGLVVLVLIAGIIYLIKRRR